MILDPRKIKSDTVSTVSPCISHEVYIPTKVELNVLVINTCMLSHMGVLSRIIITNTCGN